MLLQLLPHSTYLPTHLPSCSLNIFQKQKKSTKKQKVQIKLIRNQQEKKKPKFPKQECFVLGNYSWAQSLS